MPSLDRRPPLASHGPWVPLLLASLLVPSSASAQSGTVLFTDDFSSGLGGWTFPYGQGQRIIDSGDPEHGPALELRTVTNPVFALARGSEAWGAVRMEGWMLFPEDVHNYLGFIYRYQAGDRRIDFGSLYVKGNGSYIRANPHRDVNVGRTLYEDFRTPLEGDATIEIGRWQSFALEVVGSDAHLYVGPSTEPRVTFSLYEGDRGAFGFKPRNPGGAVWVDDVRVTSIDEFSYQGAPRPVVSAPADEVLTDWQVLGPLTSFQEDVENQAFRAITGVVDDGRTVRWRPFGTDARGAVVTARVTEHRGARRVAYFRTTFEADADGVAELLGSSVDALALWLNGEFLGFASPDGLAWSDFATNPERNATMGTVEVRQGRNELLVRVVGGSYASGGFFMGIRPSSGGPEPDRRREEAHDGR